MGAASVNLEDNDGLAKLAATCVFIDNKIKNVDAAKSVGFHTIHYEAVFSTEADLEASLADVGVFLDPEE